MIKHADSHLDHHLTAEQIRYLLDRFGARDAFFIETIELPDALGTVPCALWGPFMGDEPVKEAEVVHEVRGTRAWSSRLVARAARPTRKITVIAGPHEVTCPHCNGERQIGSWKAAIPCGCGDGKLRYPCILYTAFGGPQAPQEPGDPGCKDLKTSAAFWHQHALAK